MRCMSLSCSTSALLGLAPPLLVALKRSSGVTASLTLNCLVLTFECERLVSMMLRSEVELLFSGQCPAQHTGRPISLVGGASLGLLG